MRSFLKFAILALLIATASDVQAQFLRSSYFMEGSQYRLQLNPALAPNKGYVNIPVIGNVNAGFYSNSLGLSDFTDIIKNSDDADYFTSDKFMNKLKPFNEIGINAGTDIASAGWWRGKNFWSFNLGVKVNGGAKVPKELFHFLRDMTGSESNDYTNYIRDFSHEELNINAYTELAAGYARQINERLNVGGRAKLLLGVGNMNIKVHNATIETKLTGVPQDINWEDASVEELSKAKGTADIIVDAELDYSFKGINLITNENGYIDDVKFESKDLGVAGVGAAIDLGVSYRVINNLTLSAAILDLGFIKWSKGCTEKAFTNTDDLHFNSDKPEDIERFADIVGSNKALNFDLLKLTFDSEQKKSRTTSLATSLVLGANYDINSKISVGALFTEYMSKPKSQTELTLSLNLHPKNSIDFTFSYSPIMCSGSSFGLAARLGPLFIGTDYMFFGNGTKCCNALIGFSVPLGSKKIAEFNNDNYNL